MPWRAPAPHSAYDDGRSAMDLYDYNYRINLPYDDGHGDAQLYNYQHPYPDYGPVYPHHDDGGLFGDAGGGLFEGGLEGGLFGASESACDEPGRPHRPTAEGGINQHPINARPSGQDGQNNQQGTRDSDSGPADTPVNTQTQAETNVDAQAAAETQFQGTSQAEAEASVLQAATIEEAAGEHEQLCGTTCSDGDGYLYRGIDIRDPRYGDALEGRSSPRGGHDDPKLHAAGRDLDSIFTSWTHDYEGLALDAAEEVFGKPGGIVLRILEEDIPADRNIQIHHTELQTYAGEEHALIGVIEGAEVSVDRGPWIKPGPGTVIEDVRDPYDRNYKW